MSAPVYLDHNATTPVLPEVVDAMLPWLREHFGNPSSGHAWGRRAAEAVATAREQVAGLLGAHPDEILFTGGGTEASNLAILGHLHARGDGPHRIVTSAIEHPATSAPCAHLAARGHPVITLPVTPEGTVDLDAAATALASPAALLSVMHANNETGVLQPVAALSALARAAGATVHTDAAQSLGKVPVDVDALGVDLLTIAGHKLYAPKGVGALYRRRGTALRPVLYGAGHEGGVRPGTENVPYIVGLGVACALAARDLDREAQRVRGLRDRLQAGLRAAIPGAVVHGDGVERLPNTLNLRVPGVRGAELLAACPEIGASTGSACHEGAWTASAVLTAMGIPEQEALGALRLTLGRGTTEQQVDRAVELLRTAFEERARG